MRAFRLISERDLKGLEGWATGVADAWAAHWLPDGAMLAVRPSTAPVTSETWGDVLLVGDGGQNWCAVRAERPALRRLATALVCDDPRRGERLEGELVERLCERALADVGLRLLAGAGPTGHAVTERGDAPAEAFLPGSGAVELSIELDESAIQILLAPALTALHCGEATGLPEVDGDELRAPASALDRQRVHGVCELADTELELGSLASLSVGDVIVLDHSLERPVRLRFFDADVRCDGFLCERNERNALLLTGPAEAD